jgi:hypothetical protein
MVSHFVKELNKIGKLICCLDCSGILRENLFFQGFEFDSLGEIKQFQATLKNGPIRLMAPVHHACLSRSAPSNKLFSTDCCNVFLMVSFSSGKVLGLPQKDLLLQAGMTRQ